MLTFPNWPTPHPQEGDIQDHCKTHNNNALPNLVPNPCEPCDVSSSCAFSKFYTMGKAMVYKKWTILDKTKQIWVWFKFKFRNGDLKTIPHWRSPTFQDFNFTNLIGLKVQKQGVPFQIRTYQLSEMFEKKRHKTAFSSILKKNDKKTTLLFKILKKKLQKN